MADSGEAHQDGQASGVPGSGPWNDWAWSTAKCEAYFGRLYDLGLGTAIEFDIPPEQAHLFPPFPSVVYYGGFIPDIRRDPNYYDMEDDPC